MVVVTAGNKYLDIDAYASCVAYVKLLNAMGVDAVFASSATINASVSSVVRRYDHMILGNYVPQKDDKFIVLDVSNPDFIDKIVQKSNLIEIIDHHTGFETYWNKNGRKVQIEFIGSVATIIFEKIVEANKTEILNPDMCKLLIAAILDNTLNLKASITTDRDLKAYKMLSKIGRVPKSFKDEYFNSCQEEINKNIVLAIEKDVKTENISKEFPSVFGQLTIYSKQPIFNKLGEIERFFESFNKPWILNLICIKDGKSYIFSSRNAKRTIETLFCKKFKNNVLTLSKFMLRKQIIKQARELLENK